MNAGQTTWTGLVVPASGSLAVTVTASVSLASAGDVTNLAKPTGDRIRRAGATCVVTPTPAAVTVAKTASESITSDGIAEDGEQRRTRSR
ncbi:MAG: hypothetical protein R3F12_11685 [Lysobacteraceae bacterium]